jgi:Ubiquitin carboxyl-terminal hydrolase
LNNYHFFDIIVDRNIFTLSDRYFKIPFLCGRWQQRTYRKISPGNGFTEVPTTTKKSFDWMITLLKVVSYATLILPIAFMIVKMIGYFTVKNRKIVTSNKASIFSKIQPSSTKPEKFTNLTLPPEEIAALPPTGIPNYGNSCWFATAIQLIFSSWHTVKEMHQPLVHREILWLKKEKNGSHLLQTRQETDEELECRKDLQNSFIKLFENYQSGDKEKTSRALKALHEKILKLKTPGYIPKIGSVGCMEDGFNAWRAVFSTIDVTLLPLLLKTNEEIYQKSITKLFALKQPPKNLFLQFQLHDMHPNDASSLFNDTLLFCSTDGKKQLKYRLKGIYSHENHHVCYVRKENRWYRCDDGSVKEQNLTKIPDSKPLYVFLERT